MPGLMSAITLNSRPMASSDVKRLSPSAIFWLWAGDAAAKASARTSISRFFKNDA